MSRNQGNYVNKVSEKGKVVESKCKVEEKVKIVTKVLSIGLEALKECVLVQNGRIDAPLLLLGLMYWKALVQ
jgi:hypothetical protein